MINLIRHQDFFDPVNIDHHIHVIGVGAVGSHIATFLTRLGVKSLHIWDFDTVDSHNIPNQMYRESDIGQSKVDALAEQLLGINSELKIQTHHKYENQTLSGYLFVAVDNIELRHKIYTQHEFIAGVKAVFDTRIGLDIGQVFSADWTKDEQVQNIIAASTFTHEEVEEETTACGSKLAVLPTVILAANTAVTNFINFHKTSTLKTFISFNSFDLKISQ